MTSQAAFLAGCLKRGEQVIKLVRLVVLLKNIIYNKRKDNKGWGRRMAKATLQTVERALQLLEILAEHPRGMQPKEIEEVLELNKVTVHRLLATLENRGFIERISNAYVIGLKVVELSSMKLSNVELKTEAVPYLRELVSRIGLPVQMAILEGIEAVFIEKIECMNSFRMYSQIGKRIPVYASGVGKVLLLQESDEAIKHRLEGVEFNAFTSKTPKDVDELLEAIKVARKKGYAVDDEEHEKGIFCVAAPIYDYRDRIIAAISVGDINRQFIKGTNAKQIELIKQAAREISRRLGYLG